MEVWIEQVKGEELVLFGCELVVEVREFLIIQGVVARVFWRGAKDHLCNG